MTGASRPRHPDGGGTIGRQVDLRATSVVAGGAVLLLLVAMRPLTDEVLADPN